MIARALTADSLTITYGPTPAVDTLTIEVPAGTTTAIIGPNGSGKSTLLRAIAGLIEPASGTLEVPARAQRTGVALVLQNTVVDGSLPLTVDETVRMGRFVSAGLLGRLSRDDRAAVDAALERVDVADLRRKPLGELSGGQRQRVFVAQGVAQQSDLLLLDEPFTGVDAVSRQRIFDVIADERSAGRTVMLSTHDLQDARRCDLVLVLATRQIAFGPPDEVLRPVTLSKAFGNRVVTLDDRSVFVDDPHHGPHDHGPHLGSHDH